ncbi:MAG: DotU family type IV/VI secretion system protein [Gammaproteobacteria bacterium]|nr:DotU family type IV/VI secretion system protein [Gammaproteobacteria bacterium]
MKLIDAFIPLFAASERYRQQPQLLSNRDYGQVRTEFERMLVESGQRAREYGYGDEEYDYARFAVIAYLDELMLSQQWQGRQQWLKEMLQKVHFGSASGGTEFYQRLETLNPVNPGEKDVREVFFYALCFGFCGKYYRDRDKVTRQQIIQSNYDILAPAGRLEGDPLFPVAFADKVSGSQIKRTLDFTTLVLGIPLLLIIALFFAARSEMVELAQKMVLIF